MACDARLIEIASASAALCTCIIFHDTRRHDPGKIFFNCPAPGKNIHFVDRLFFVDGCERMADDIPSLSLFLSRSPLVYSSPRRAANTGRLMTLRGPPFAGIRVSARRWAVLGGATITSPLHSIPIDSSVTNCIMASSRKDTRGEGGEESNREMMFANRLTTAQRRFMLLGRFANREIGK